MKRRLLGPLAVVCLCWQAVTLSLPLAVWSATIGISNCTCATREHAMCPMHHGGPKAGCAIRAANEDTPVMPVPLTVVGVLPTASPGGAVAPLAAATAPHHTHAFSALQIPPDSPPPRA